MSENDILDLFKDASTARKSMLESIAAQQESIHALGKLAKLLIARIESLEEEFNKQ